MNRQNQSDMIFSVIPRKCESHPACQAAMPDKRGAVLVNESAACGSGLETEICRMSLRIVN